MFLLASLFIDIFMFADQLQYQYIFNITNILFAHYVNLSVIGNRKKTYNWIFDSIKQ